MPPKSVEFPRFAGLDLRQDPQEIGPLGALDLLNVDLDRADRVRSRDGYAKFTAAANADRVIGLHGWSQTTNASYYRLIATTFGASPKVHAYQSAGVFASSGVLAGLSANYVSIGNLYVYGGTGTAATAILRWSEAAVAWSDVAVGYSGTFVGLQPYDNRLVLASTNDNGHWSRVRFSNANNAEVFTAGDYVDLMPYDGGRINGIASFNDKLFVFKEDKFFVFTGNSTLSSGAAVFNYRIVDTGVGIPDTFRRCCVSSPRGVYFLGYDGVYLTTGGPAVKVSAALDPLFRNTMSATYQGTAINATTIPWNNQVSRADMTWSDDRLYVTVPTGVGATATADRIFVLDPDHGWLVWDIAASALTTWPLITQHGLYFSYAAGTNDIGLISSASASDVGVGISSRYRTGFWNPGQPGAESWVRECLIDGTGAVTVKTAVNDAATLGTGQAVTLGTSPAVAQGRDRRGFMGRNVSYEFSGASAWSISRVTPIVWGQRAPGLKAA